MDMSNIADIVITHVDVEPINLAIKNRAEALAGQMNQEASEQFLSEMNEIICSVSANNGSLSFSIEPSESYLLNYLKNHGTPVAGGDGGTAHNVDGSTYESRVPVKFWGTELPELELPTLDGEDEAYHIVEIMSPDAAQNAVSDSKDEIAETIVKPFIIEQLSNIGGGAS